MYQNNKNISAVSEIFQLNIFCEIFEMHYLYEILIYYMQS